MAGSSPIVAPMIMMRSRASAVHFFQDGTGRVGISLPLVIIKNTDESPQVLVKSSSASKTSVSPCCSLTSPKFSVMICPPWRISLISAPYFLLKSKFFSFRFSPGKRDASTTSTMCCPFSTAASASSSSKLSGLSAGSSFFDVRMMKSSPTTVMGMPMKAKSNIFSPPSPLSIIIPCTTRFVDVPMSVHNPPRMVAYERGIRNFVHDRPIFFAQFFTIGANITTTGVLFRKAENALTMGRRRSWALVTVVSFSGRSFFTMVLNAPLCLTPSLTRNRRATVIIPRLLNPATICLGVIIPAAMNTTTKDSSTMPGRILSRISAVSIPISPSSTNIISKFIFFYQIVYRSSESVRRSVAGSTMNHGFSRSSLLYWSGLSLPAL